MKTTTFYALTLAVLTTACATDKPSESTVANDELSVQMAFYGLTIVDCQQQATQCYRTERHALGCSSKLARCLSRAGAEVAKGVLAETKDVAACGKSGVQCVGDATKLSMVLSCEDQVEHCVLSSVNDLTGIPLPSSQQVATAVVAHADEVVETAVAVGDEVVHTGVEVVEHVAETALDTTHEVVHTAVEVGGRAAQHAVAVTGEVLETAHEVTGEVLETAHTVTHEVVETAHEVTTEVVETATGVVSDVVDTGLHVGKTALQCGEESRTCVRTTKKLLSCQLAYAECMSKAL